MLPGYHNDHFCLQFAHNDDVNWDVKFFLDGIETFFSPFACLIKCHKLFKKYIFGIFGKKK